MQRDIGYIKPTKLAKERGISYAEGYKRKVR